MAINTLTESLDSLWTSTWPKFKPGVIDQIFLKRYPLFWWLSQKGHVQYISDGRDIRFPLEVDVNPTVEEIGPSGEVSVVDVDPFTTGIYPWAELAGNINRYRQEDTENTGESQVFKLLEAKRKNLVKSISKKFEELFFRTVATRPAYGFYGLNDLVDTTPTTSRTVGNFDQCLYPWWQNRTRTSSGVAATNLRKDMQELFYDLEDTESEPDVIVCHRNAYASYEDDLLEMKMIVNKALADAGFSNLVFKGVPMIKSPSCPSTKLFMLNAMFLYLVLHRGMNFEMTDWKEHLRQPFNRVAQIVVKGQLLATNRDAQGVLHTLTY